MKSIRSLLFLGLSSVTIFAGEPGPVADSFDLKLADKEVTAFYQNRTDDGANAIAKKVIPELKALGINGNTPFHFRYTKKALDLFFTGEEKGVITVRAVKLVFLVNGSDECYSYGATLAELSLGREALEAAFAKKPESTALVKELREKLKAYGVKEKSKVEVTGKRIVFENGLTSAYPTVEISIEPKKEKEELKSFSFEFFAYPQGVDPGRKIGRAKTRETFRTTLMLGK